MFFTELLVSVVDLDYFFRVFVVQLLGSFLQINRSLVDSARFNSHIINLILELALVEDREHNVSDLGHCHHPGLLPTLAVDVL